MNFFANLEKSLEKIIEKSLLGKIASKVQPVEIAKGIWQEITLNKRITVSGILVPNFFTVKMSPGDFSCIDSIRGTVEAEIIDHIKKESDKRDFKTVGAIAIKWLTDKQEKEGCFTVMPEFKEGIPESPKPEHTEKEPIKADNFLIYEDLPLSSPAEKSTGNLANLRGFLTVSEGFDKGRIFQLFNNEYVLGRSNECNIEIGDPSVSRRHARIYMDENKYYIEDLDSKTGTYLNGEKIEKHVLSNGNEIKIGLTIMHYTGI